MELRGSMNPKNPNHLKQAPKNPNQSCDTDLISMHE